MIGCPLRFLFTTVSFNNVAINSYESVLLQDARSSSNLSSPFEWRSFLNFSIDALSNLQFLRNVDIVELLKFVERKLLSEKKGFGKQKRAKNVDRIHYRYANRWNPLIIALFEKNKEDSGWFRRIVWSVRIAISWDGLGGAAVRN